ncbi:MAG: hypothetical protein QM780_01440 [Hyphomicrobium sp.]|uniref:hypothetical protein n=1 Tax=Hyphomicrobium sp. TaxID=82 RepID=UPI0039E4F4C9
MSVSPVGNSDAYARYRQQALDLLASPSQPGTQAQQTTAPSYVAPQSWTEQSSSNSFTTKFKADLTSLNSSQDGNSRPHPAHGHHHQSASQTDPTTNEADASATTTNASTTTDALSQALDEFADLLKTAAGIASIIV